MMTKEQYVDAVHEGLKELEQKGAITAQAQIVAILGIGLTAFLSVMVEIRDELAALRLTLTLKG
jgi:hypothetical protein